MILRNHIRMSLQIREHVPLAPLTTFRIGGTARYYARVVSVDALHEACAFAKHKGVPFFILGGGSNILVPDGGFDGIVIHMDVGGYEWHQEQEGMFVRVGAGENWDTFVAKTIEKGWYDLANLSHIPGSVGASPVQNIGAYGVEVCDTIDSVEVYDTRTKESKALTNTECGFTYRDSIFKSTTGSDLIITHVTFRLENTQTPILSYKDIQEHFKGTEKTPTPQEVRNAIIEIRKKKFPDLSKTGTAGSFFKNPVITEAQYIQLKVQYKDLPSYEVDEKHVKVPLAWILDTVCNLKGYTRNGVGLFEKQPLVMVNYGNAKAQDVDVLAQYVTQKVYDATQIQIEREVRTLA